MDLSCAGRCLVSWMEVVCVGRSRVESAVSLFMNEWGTYFCERAEVSVMNEWRGSKKHVMYTVKDVRAFAAVLHFCVSYSFEATKDRRRSWVNKRPVMIMSL